MQELETKKSRAVVSRTAQVYGRNKSENPLFLGFSENATGVSGADIAGTGLERTGNPVQKPCTKHPDHERFYSKTRPDTESDCLLWVGSKNEKGYGHFSVGKRPIRAHRWAWVMEYGPIPDGKHVLHSCDNPACVNLKHLSLGTNKQNSVDSVLKGRHGTAVLTPELALQIIDSKLGPKATAKAMGLPVHLVRNVMEKRSWKSVKPHRLPRSQKKYAIDGRLR